MIDSKSSHIIHLVTLCIWLHYACGNIMYLWLHYASGYIIHLVAICIWLHYFFFFLRFLLLKKKGKKKPLAHRGPIAGALPQDLYKQGNMLLNMHIKVQYRLTCDGLNHKQ